MLKWAVERPPPGRTCARMKFVRFYEGGLLNFLGGFLSEGGSGRVTIVDMLIAQFRKQGEKDSRFGNG